LRQIGVPGEAELAGRGVSQCDWCDGGLYRGLDVVVVGGGNAALQAALHLSELCSSVAIVARGASLRARRDYVLRAADNERISFHWETQVQAIVGHSHVEAVRLKSLSDDCHFELACAGVFVFAGLVPNLDFAPADLETDSDGRVVTDRDCRTSIPGIFAVGAVRSGNRGSLLSAMGEAAAAAAAAAGDAHPPAQ
jgi:thioredoxin reductase (NADPH)